MPETVRVDRRVALALGAAMITPPSSAATGSDAQNIALARRHLLDIWQDGKFESAGEIFHPEFVDRTPVPGQAPGAAGIVEFAKIVKIALPDQRFEFVKLFAAGDLVVDHWVLRATHTGPLGKLPPTGRKVEFDAIDILRVQDGRIIEIWHVEDMLTMFAQLGLVEPPQIA